VPTDAGDVPAAPNEAPVRVLRLAPRSVVVALLVIAIGMMARTALGRSTRVLGWVAFAALVAGLLHPLVEVFGRQMRRGMAVLVAILLTLSVTGFIGYTVVDSLRTENARLQRVLPEAAHRIETSQRFGQAASDFGLSQRVDEVLAALPSRLTGGTGAAAIRSTASRGVALLANLVLTIFLLLYGPRLVRSGLDQTGNPVTRARLSHVLERGYRRAWRYIIRSLGKGVLGGVFAFSVAHIAGLPAAIVLAVVLGLLSIVPYVGVVLGGTPLVLLAAAGSGSGWAAMAVVVAVLGWQVVDGLVLQPWVHRGSITFGPTLTVVVSMVCFELAGLGGVLIGLAFAVLIGSVADEVATNAGVEDFVEDARSARGPARSA
jgi:predicted PurR-regulated permease PerM